jgi:hypothetical protein
MRQNSGWRESYACTAIIVLMIPYGKSYSIDGHESHDKKRGIRENHSPQKMMILPGYDSFATLTKL